MNSNSLSASMQRNIALAKLKDESQSVPAATNQKPSKTKTSVKRIFEYRGSSDLQIPNQAHAHLKNEDYFRPLQSIEPPQDGHHGSFGLSEIKHSPTSNFAKPAPYTQQPVPQPMTQPSTYSLKRQQAHQRQVGVRKDVQGIVGRRVDAPHIIVPSQGPAGLIDFEAREQGSMGMMSCQPATSTLKLMAARGSQTVSLSPKHSPWKKSSKAGGSSNFARGKPKNLFGQVKLCFNQGGGAVTNQSRKAAQKNLRSQPGKTQEQGRGSRTAKSMEQVRHLQRPQTSTAGAQNSKQPQIARNQETVASSAKNKAVQQAGRKTVMQERTTQYGDQSMECLKQQRPGGTTRQQRSQLSHFLDTSMLGGEARAGNQSSIQIQNQGSEISQNLVTLNILTATADHFANQGPQASATLLAHYTGAKCKSVAARHHPSDQSRQLIQTKYLNFQREANQQSRKRDHQSVERVNHHRTGVSRAKTALAAQQQTIGQTRGNQKAGSGANRFQMVSSSQGRASNSAGATSIGHSRAFGVCKNQTIEIELRRRSKSRQGHSGGVLSDTPNKAGLNQKRARSGGSSNKRKQQLLGPSASFSPRSRATTQFQEARSLLFENQSSGLSVNSKKQNVNQLLNNLDSRHKKQMPSKQTRLLAGSQEYLAMPSQSAAVLQAQQSSSVCPSAVNLTAALNQAYNLSSVLLQVPATDPNTSLQPQNPQVLASAKLLYQNDNLRSSIAETQVGDASQNNVQIGTSVEGGTEDNQSVASRQLAHLNASLGRILNQSVNSHAPQRGGGTSQSPKGSRGAINRSGITCQGAGHNKSNVVSAANSSRIDKIIAENLKKQGKKTMQRKIREQEEEQVSRKKRAELELVNERVRNANKEKVQRRKLQQMLLMQTNNTSKIGKIARAEDTIAEEMKRMLDALPENTIFKSQKTSKKANQENIALQQQQAAQSSTKIASSKEIQAPAKQLQASTQKIELKFNQEQRMDDLFTKVQRSNESNQVGARTIQAKRKYGQEGLPPRQLVVNRLGMSKRGDTYENNTVKQQSRDRSTDYFDGDDVRNEASEDHLLPVEGKNKITARLKDHRKSYGLEFIDIRREIIAELKRIGGGKSPRVSVKTSKALHKGANLRFIDNLERMTNADHSETLVMSGAKNSVLQNLRGSKSQKQVQTEKAQSTVQDDLANADLSNFRATHTSQIEPRTQLKILKPSQVSLRVKAGGVGDKRINQSLVSGLGIVFKKEKIRKFMLRKQKQKLEEEEKTKLEEIQKTLKVHQNLLNLDKFAKKKLKVLQPGTGPRTGKASQQAGPPRQRNHLVFRKNMTLVNKQADSEQCDPSVHNLTITPSKTGLEVSEPSFNVSAKLQQRVSNKQTKRTSKKDADTGILIDPTITADFFQAGDQDLSEHRPQRRRSSHSRANEAKSTNQLAPQFENSTSAKTLRMLRKQGSQSPPTLEVSRQENNQGASLETAKVIVKSKSGGRRSTHQPKPAKQSQMQGAKIAKKGGAKHSKKRDKSGARKSQGTSGSNIQLHNKRLDVRMPEVTSLATKNRQNSSGKRHQHSSSLQRSSIQTLESHDSHSKHRASFQRQRMPSTLVSAQRPDRDLAAKVIQTEVRKYLKSIGFYHARQVDSPAREAQVSLFIERKNLTHTKKSKQSKSGGSHGRRLATPPHISEDERLADSDPQHPLQETTIIAELSGLKQTDFFYEEGQADDEKAASGRRSKDQSRKNRPRKGKQKSTSSERDREPTSGKVLTTHTQKPKPRTHHQMKVERLVSGQAPSKQLNPVFKDLFSEGKTPENERVTGLELASSQTPQSRGSKLVVNLEKIKSEKSLQVQQIAELDLEQRQAHSSVESNSVERLGMLGQGGQEGASQSSNSLFDRNAFQQYSKQKLQVLMQNSEQSKLIKFREDVLKYKEQKERRHIKKLFKDKEVSPRTFQLQQKQIDRWVRVQKQEIEKTKTTFKEEWDKTIQLIEDTQKNVDQMKSKMFAGPSHHSNSGVISVSGQSATKPNGLAAASQLNNFNSQSCNSLSSHRNYQRSAANNNGVGQLALSGLGEHQRSILIEDPPKSYRSGRQEISQMQILANLKEEINGGDEGHTSLGLLSSRQSQAGLDDNLTKAKSLLTYMEQRLASHHEPKPGRNRVVEEEVKHAFDRVEVVNPLGKAEYPEGREVEEKLSSSQRIAGLSSTFDRMKQHSRMPSSNSVVESDSLSHQPSAEFLERLERVNKQEPFISSALSDKLLGPDFVNFDDPMMMSVVPSDMEAALLNEADPLSQLEGHDRNNFKNQVMTIRDFGAIDSKRTSQASETSNEREFMKMLAAQQVKASLQLASDGVSPSAEHLEEPSLVGKRESQVSKESVPGGSIQSVRIADILKDPALSLDGFVKDQLSSQRSGPNDPDLDLLQEPAIISSSQTLETSTEGASSYHVFDPSNPNLIPAKVRPNPDSVLQTLKLGQIETLFRNSSDQALQSRIVDALTDDFMKSMLADAMAVASRASHHHQQSKQSASQDAQPTGQHSNHDVYLIDQQQSEKEERKEWIELRQRHLIENDLIRIDQYVNEIVDALLQFEIDISSEGDDDLSLSARELREKELKGNYHVQFLKQLTLPIQKPCIETLQALQTSEIGSYKHFETTQDLQKYPIIPVNLYLDIEKAREEALLARRGPSMSKQTQMVWESIHIQNKSYFDAINESLMKFRPYGLTGEPMPWSNKIRRLQTKVDIGSVDTERLFQMVKQEVFRWAQAFCGSLPSPVFCFPSAHARDKQDFNDELFQENREKRLTQVLSAETVEQEHHWLNYEYEEAQVKIDLSDMILEHLVDELVSFLNRKSNSLSIGPSELEICELHDEPGFTQTKELAAAEVAEVHAYLAGPLPLGNELSTKIRVATAPTRGLRT